MVALFSEAIRQHHVFLLVEVSSLGNGVVVDLTALVSKLVQLTGNT